MGPPSYMRSVVDRNVVMRHMTVQTQLHQSCASPEMYSHKSMQIMKAPDLCSYKLCSCALIVLCSCALIVLCSCALIVLCSCALIVLCSCALIVLCSCALIVLCSCALIVLCSSWWWPFRPTIVVENSRINYYALTYFSQSLSLKSTTGMNSLEMTKVPLAPNCYLLYQ